MFHAAQAAVSFLGVRLPKTHKGTINLFGEHLVKTGKITKEYSRHLGDAFTLRQHADYEVDASLDEQQAQQLLEQAEAFVAEVKKVIGTR